jgi:diguanylate cyclase (GGDEF)-like protein
MKILVIDDDESVIQTLTTTLSAQNYAVEVATTGKAGLALIESFDYDLIVLDILLPKIDGIHLCQQVRSQGYQMPILLLSGCNAHHDRAVGLDAGADDYVVKPFDPEELLARIRALLRRVSATAKPLLEWGELMLDPSACKATYGDTLLNLTPKEYALLELFLRNSRRVFSCSAILEHLWVYEDTPGEEAVRTHIKGLRQKLKAAGATADLIETVYGIGYRLKVIPTKSSELSPVAASELRSQLQVVWQNSQSRIEEQIQVLEKAARQNPTLDAELQQQAYREAHTLAGALGTFGFAEGSRLAREIEHLLNRSRSLKQQDLQSLKIYIAGLRRAIDLPLHIQPADVANQPSARSSLKPTAERPTLLIVDTDQIFIDLLSHAAEQRDFQVAIATTAQSAERFLSKHTPTAVLLDLDRISPLSAGLSLIHHCHQQSPEIPTLVFTQHDDLTKRVEVIRQGGRWLLQKPIAPEAVLEAVQQVTQRADMAQPKVLIVDDDESILSLLKTLLEPWGLSVTTLADPHRFLETLETCLPNLLILDIEMPDISGIELCQVARNDSRWSSLPILFLTAHRHPEVVNEVFRAGADDFVSKPVVGPELVTRIINRLERMKLTRRLIEIDPLTGVMNSTKSQQELENFLKLAERWQQPLAIAVLDVDRMRQINDKYGQTTGDAILRQLGHLLRQLFRSEDIVARWGGEEFVIGMYGITQEEGVHRVTQVLQALQAQGNRTAAGELTSVTFSAGVAQYPQDGIDVRSLYRSATKALQRAKQAGGNCAVSTQAVEETV